MKSLLKNVLDHAKGEAKPEVGRKYPLRMPPNWEPPYPSFESQFGDATQVSMAVIGCQFQEGDRAKAQELIAGVAASLRTSGAADHVDLSYCAKDSTGCQQLVATAYWLKPDIMTDYFGTPSFKAWWTRAKADPSGIGVFRELFNIPLGRFETLHSGPDHVVGVAHARASLSDMIQTHAYWGGMRDRIPDSANDAFDPAEVIERESSGDEIVVKLSENVAVIRSGQDIQNAESTERREYYSDVEPTLKAGMDFLRDEGEEVNCFDCRYMTFIDDGGNAIEHTYGLAYFRSLGDLEFWAEKHPSHLAIFNAFLEFAPRYGPAMKSRYWHEVSVLPAQAQGAVYANCRPGTGFLQA